MESVTLVLNLLEIKITGDMMAFVSYIRFSRVLQCQWLSVDNPLFYFFYLSLSSNAVRALGYKE